MSPSLTTNGFVVKDSGERLEYESGMVRDTQDGKPDYSLVFDGPMVDRLAVHLTKGAEKYGKRNWQLANSEEELSRFKASAVRHFRQWLRGDLDEDHFAATIFNMNACEYVLDGLIHKAMSKPKPKKCCGDPGDCGNCGR